MLWQRSLLFVVKVRESRHEGGVKVAGCSFSSLRRSNIFVSPGFDLHHLRSIRWRMRCCCLWTIQRHAGCLQPRPKVQFALLDLAAPYYCSVEGRIMKPASCWKRWGEGKLKLTRGVGCTEFQLAFR